MCKTLSELLDADQPLFSITLEQLERASGQTSEDVRLMAEIIGKVHQKTKELGLDPHDTTGKELYHALKELVKKHDQFIAETVGAKDATDVEDVIPRLIALIGHINIPKTAWVIKHSVAKRLLKAYPPKKVMKHLGYRSVDSMLKRESMGVIFGAIRFAESPLWLESFVQKYKKLTPQDFELRRIEIVQLDEKRWGKVVKKFVEKNHHNITHVKEMGVILVLPLPVKRMKGVSITVLPLILHYINEIRLYSSYFKMRQVSPDFADVLIDAILNDPAHHANMAGNAVHWRIIHRYFGGADKVNHPEIFEPHIQPEDLHWRKAEEIMFRIEPALHFWHDMDFVATLKDGHILSFNLMDMAVSYVNDLPYGQQSNYHFRDSLWNEIYIRYMGKQTLETQIINQISNKVAESEQPFYGLVEAF